MKCEGQGDQDALTDIVLYALMGVSAGAARGMPDASGMQTTLLSILRDLLTESGTPPPPSLDRLLARTRRNQQRRARRRQRDALRQQQQAGGAAGGGGGAQLPPGDPRRMRLPGHAPVGGAPPLLPQQLQMPGLPMPPLGAGQPHQLPPGALPHPLQSQLRNSNVEGNQLAQMLAQRNLAPAPLPLLQQQRAVPMPGSSQEGRRRPRQPRPPRDPWCPTDPHYRQEGDNEE
ncbi:cleavage and polyadenylation specificity factor subunit 6-like [Penaeus japonicus]|uniref:cleavage and polyadenylation specificity factor subunit 6-like n=1 Tax=Penaeus japonicus TaxID=27405 RepID=UPI001C71177C|nr:cleavage and polyadenylation specificity factor subunit 6-like [Penaeus japonicus]